VFGSSERLCRLMPADPRARRFALADQAAQPQPGEFLVVDEQNAKRIGH
jgi:hypothetical protein